MSSRGSSIGGSNSQERVPVVGVPKKCWCGNAILARTSSSDLNPYRRYLRCAYAIKHKLVNDGHDFKWVDEGALEEFETLSNRIRRLEDVFSNGMDLQLEMREELRLEAKVESKTALKMILLVVVIAFIVMLGVIKLLEYV